MRNLLIILLSVLSLAAFAQDKKTVAVLDPICRDNSVNPFYQQMVRGAMESAVTASSEYEAYDRSAFDQIQKEQAFQRTGAVNDSQIKQMGEMAGVDYVLVSEVSAYEGYLSTIIKILNVTTGKYDKSTDDYMELEPAAVKSKCREMASSLFGEASYTTQPYSSLSGNKKSGHSTAENPAAEKAKVCMANGEYRDAVAYYEQAIDLVPEHDEESRAGYLFNIAYIYYDKIKHYQLSRQYLRRSLELKPNQGRCYILMGMLYASSQPYAEYNADILNKTVFWAVVDKFQKAKLVDPDVTEDANKLIRAYSKYFPTWAEMNSVAELRNKTTFTVGGWIQETTICRAAY